MSIKVGINGFGRIGRMVFRASLDHPEIEIVGINDLCPAEYLAYMLKYDTMHGICKAEIGSTENAIVVNGKEILVSAERNPADLPWAKLGAEYVVESTGLFLTKEKAQGHLDAGAKKVIMSAPSKDDTPMFVCGVNRQHHPLLHRRCQGRGQGHPRAQRQADRHVHARPHSGRVRGGPDCQPGQARQV